MWKIAPSLLGARELRVAVVGVGGTGSEIVSNLTHLHYGMKALGYGGLHVVAFDPDRVSEANLVRQRYHRADLGRYKADTLIARVNLACGLDWESVPMRFTSKMAHRAGGWDLVISAVDSRASRAQLHKFAFSKSLHGWKLWLDCGNDATTGQVILGAPKRDENPARLKCATELHPELMDLRLPDDTAPSCSAIEALSKQDLCVNKQVAVLATDLLWRMFRDRGLRDHGRYFDLASGSMAPLLVPAQPRRSKPKAA